MALGWMTKPAVPAAVRSRNSRDLPWVRPAESISGSSPGARRSAHPDASMVAVGPLAETLTEPHELGHAFGEGSPVERFVRLGGKALLLGAPLNSVTALHYAEAVADIPNKRWVTYEMPMLGRDGEVARKTASDYDSNGILDCFAIEGKPDAVETIANAYVKLGRHREGVVGFAQCYLFDAQDIVTFGVTYLEAFRNHSDRASARGRRALLRAFRLEAVDNDNLDQRTFRRRKDDAR